jgi:hypothetical protein
MLTRMSTPPNVFSIASAAAPAPSAVERSAAKKSMPGSVLDGAERAVAITLAPASRSVCATAAPAPLVPPVTRARLSVSSKLKDTGSLLASGSELDFERGDFSALQHEEEAQLNRASGKITFKATRHDRLTVLLL